MERIGIAASKIAKGNLFLYNFVVILIVLVFSLLIFFLAGCSIVIVLVLMAYVSKWGSLPDLQKGWMPLMVACLKSLAALVGLLAFYAVAKNFRLKRP